MRCLSRLLRPRSIAVLGGVWAEKVILQCQKMNYRGKLWAVHPHRRKMGGIPCVSRLAELPMAPDAAFIGVNRHASITAAAELSAMGAGGAVCFASGFAEAGGKALQSRLVAAAGDMPILGPNCYGMINYVDGVAVWPDQHGGRQSARGAAIIGQSSNILINLSSQRRGLPLSYLIAAGNQAQCRVTDIAANLLEDQRVSVIGFYLESIGDAVAFAEMAALAAKKNVSLVALVAGKSRLARRTTASHTAALMADGASLSAFLRRCGVAEIASMGEFLETLKLLHTHGALAGTRLVSLSCSGGEAALAADLAAQRQLRFLPFTAKQKSALQKTLGTRVRVANPLDYHTYIWHDQQALRETYAAATSGRHDCAFLIFDFPRADRCCTDEWKMPLSAFIAAAGKKCAVVASLPENMPEDIAESLLAAGIAPLCGLEDALSAMRAAAALGGKPDCAKGWRPWAAGACDNGDLANEFDAKNLLQAGGIVVPRGAMVKKRAQAMAIFRTLNIKRAAVKLLGVAHKTDVGGVQLNVTAQSLSAVIAAMPAGELLLEEMIEDTVAELLIGVRRCRVFGATLTVGMGGVQAEVLADTQTLILPATAADIRRAMAQLKLLPRRRGGRGTAANLTAAAQTAAAVGRLLMRHPHLLEIEINPLILTGGGTAVAADALITMRKKHEHD